MSNSSRGSRPRATALFPVYDLELQARIMQVLGDKAVVPVPRVVEYVADTQFLGSPFLVMERVAGRIPSDNPPFVISGWVHDAAARIAARAPGRVHVGVRRHSSRRLAGARAR